MRTIFSSDVFLKSFHWCLKSAIEVPNEMTAALWLEFALRDLKMFFKYQREGL